MKTSDFDKMSELEFAALILQQQFDKLPNRFTRLANKLESTIMTLKDLDHQEKTRSNSWWHIQYYNENGQRLLPQEVSEYELDRIGTAVSQGFGSGELVP